MPTNLNVTGPAERDQVLATLVARGCRIEMMPLPDDQYRFVFVNDDDLSASVAAINTLSSDNKAKPSDDSHVFAICKHCDHFVDVNTPPDSPIVSGTRYTTITTDDGTSNITQCRYIHLEDGEQEFDHDAEPGESHSLKEWHVLRPDLFMMHSDERVGPNSVCHSRRGKVACEGCEKETPGIRPYANFGNEHAGKPITGFVAVERCDTCNKYPDDLAAATAWGTEAQWQEGNNTSQAICKPPMRNWKIGERVYWSDPDRDAPCSGPGVVLLIAGESDLEPGFVFHPDYIIMVQKDDGGEVECHHWELCPETDPQTPE